MSSIGIMLRASQEEIAKIALNSPIYTYFRQHREAVSKGLKLSTRFAKRF
jgi:hypothetical protein